MNEADSVPVRTKTRFKLDVEIERLSKDYWAGFLFCKQCMKFHFFPQEAKRVGALRADHAWTDPRHLTPEQQVESRAFDLYKTPIGDLYFSTTRSMIEFMYVHNEEIRKYLHSIDNNEIVAVPEGLRL